MKNQSDIYLNTLCLAAWAPGPSTIKLAKAAVRTFEDLSPEERTMITPLNMLYIKLIKDVIDGKLDLSNRAEAQNILAQYEDDDAFKTNKADYVALKTMLLPDTAPSQTAVKRLVQRVKNKIIWCSNSKKIRALSLANARAGYDDDPEKQQELLRKILEDAADFTAIYNSQNDDDNVAPVEEIDMMSIDSIVKAIQNQKKKRSGTNIKFMWQALNRMMGPSNGCAYGEFFCCAARSHNGKSLVLNSMARAHCMYNRPPDTGGKKPVILYISLENEIGENLIMLYKELYINIYHKEPEGFNDNEVAEFVMRELSKNGFHMIIKRTFGDVFGYKEYVDLVEKIEKNNDAKVVATYLDYITLCHCDKADEGMVNAKQLQMMVGRFKDFAQHRDMFFATGLQLETEAERIAASGMTNRVKRYSSAHLADSRGIKRELDILIFVEIETNASGQPWLTVAWNKHKYVHDTPQASKYFAVPFSGHLGILDDVNGKDTSSQDIYAEDDSASNTSGNQVNVF